MSTATSTTAPSDVEAVDTSPIVDRLTRPGLRAAVAIATHFVVDVFSFIGIALLPLLAVLLGIRPEQKALLLSLGAVCSGVVQPFVAWASDRHDTRALGTIGFVVAVLCIGNLGAATTFTELAVLYSVGAMGIGAFHPPAAATTGRLGGARRSVFVAIFFLAGMLGGITGNIVTPMYVDWMTPVLDSGPDPESGVLAIRYLIPIGLACALLLALAIHSVGHRDTGAHAHHVSWDARERRARWGAVGVLYGANVIRFSVNMALVYLFTEWASDFVLNRSAGDSMTEQLGIRASQINGRLQASMQVGMGGGGVALGFLLAPRFEKGAFVVLPILGAAMIASIPTIGDASPALAPWIVMGAAALAGTGFGAIIPISMSLAQRLLPHRTGLASGMMLGGAWMLAFMGPTLAELIQNGIAEKPARPGLLTETVAMLPRSLGEPIEQGLGLDAAMYAAAGALACAGVLSLVLPHKLLVRSAESPERTAPVTDA